jgi:predicted transcriptional regulator
MATSGIEDSARRLLDAFYDLSGHNPIVSIPIGTPDSTPEESAAKAAGIEPSSTECAVAVRYLLNQGYIKETSEPSRYTITVTGIERVRESRSPD